MILLPRCLLTITLSDDITIGSNHCDKMAAVNVTLKENLIILLRDDCDCVSQAPLQSDAEACVVQRGSPLVNFPSCPQISRSVDAAR